MKRINERSILTLIMVVCFSMIGNAQTTAFNYQGKLQSSSSPASGNHDFEFLLFDALNGGSQLGTTLVRPTVGVTDGVFSVSLDFGSNFPGADRFLEIHVKQTGSNTFTALTPRQLVSSAPYSIKSKEAVTSEQLGGIDSSLFVQKDVAGNVSISGGMTVAGNLSADTVNAQARYDLGGQRILSAGVGQNLFVGLFAGRDNTTGNLNTFVGGAAGQVNTTGTANSFFGANAGAQNLTGGDNSFFGDGAGLVNISGNGNAFFGRQAGLSNMANYNSFFGYSAGQSNTTGFSNAYFGKDAGKANSLGSQNAFFGYLAGRFNTVGGNNSFFGAGAGAANTTSLSNSFFGAAAGLASTGPNNSFFGESAGFSNNTGEQNAFFGYAAGETNQTGARNTIIGSLADVSTIGLANASAIGANALVSTSNSMVLGGINGINGATASTNIGIGTSSPVARFHVVGSSWFQGDNSPLPSAAGKGIIVGFSGELGYIASFDYGTFTPKTLSLNNSGGNVGIGTLSPDQTLSVNGNASKVGGGAWLVFSDERLKHIKQRFTTGLSALMQLQPLHYEYKEDNAMGIRSKGDHIGFSAQAVEKVIPEAVTMNEQGFRLVNNDPIIWTMLNAVKEQQEQIEGQNKRLGQQESQLELQRQQIEALTKLVCESNRTSSLCKERRL